MALPPRERRLLTLSLAACALYAMAAAWKVWPLVDGDGPAYFPAAVEWSLDRPLTNPVWPEPLDDSIDGPGGRRFVYHGFVYALVVGWIARAAGGGPEATVAAAYFIHWLVAFVGALAVLWSLPSEARRRSLVAVIAPLALFAWSTSTHGRVEPMALLLVASATAAWMRVRPAYGEGAAGASAALLIFTSPAIGVMAAGLLAAVLMTRSIDSVGVRVARAAVCGTMATIATVMAYPYPILDWVEGVRRHSRINFGLPVGQGFVSSWLANTDLPLLIVTFGVLFAGALLALRDEMRAVGSVRRSLIACFVGLSVVALVRVAFLKTEAVYNAVVWLPLLASATAAMATTPARVAVMVVTLTLPIVGLTRNAAILANQYRPDVATFEDVRGALRALGDRECEITGGLWLAADEMKQVTFVRSSGPQRACYVRQQTKSGDLEPPTLDDYVVTINRFGAPARVLGVPVARTPNGWEFAVYEREAVGQ